MTESGPFNVPRIFDRLINGPTPNDSSPLLLTRRELLSLSALSLSAPFHEARPVGELSFHQDGHVALFRIGDSVRWRIDYKAFSGAPQLHIERATDRIRLRLVGATLPGTALPADFDCLCWRNRGGWLIDIAVALGEFEAFGRLDMWLLGLHDLRGRFNRPSMLTALPDGLISIRGSDIQSGFFTPNWSLTADSAHVDVELDGCHVKGTALAVELHDSGTNWRGTHFTDGPGTIVGVRHAATLNSWQPHITRLVNGDVQYIPGTPGSFESLFTGGRHQDIFTVVHNGPFTYNSSEHRTRRSPSLAFESSVYYVARANDHVHRLLAAPLSRTPQNISVDAHSFLIERCDGKGLTVQSVDDRLTEFSCGASLVSSSHPLPGFLCRPCRATEPHRTSVVMGYNLSKDVGSSPNGEGSFEVQVADARIVLERPADLLNIHVTLHNLTLRKSVFHAPVLERTDPSAPAFIVAHFPTQFLTEQAFYRTDSPTTSEQIPVPPVKSVYNKDSRLAFRLPDTVQELRYDRDALLDWTSLIPESVPHPRLPDAIREPTLTQTAVEIPYRLVLAPLNGRWKHSLAATGHAPAEQSVELWHTWIADSRPVSIAAVWSPDFGGAAEPAPLADAFRVSLNNIERHRLVRLTHDQTTGPEPATADLLALSSLGGWLEVKGHWPFTNERANIPLEKWTHSVHMGREQEADVETRGFAYPFGHECVILKKTTRDIAFPELGQGPSYFGGYLEQRTYLTVKYPTKYYSDPTFPFVSVTFLDPTSPPLDEPTGIERNQCGHPPATAPSTACDDARFWCNKAFWPFVAGQPYYFRMAGVDRAGNTVHFSSPVIFIEDSQVTLASAVADAKCEFDWWQSRHRVNLTSQLVALAKSIRKGDTEIHAIDLDFGGGAPLPGPPLVSGRRESPFRPIVRRISGTVPALEHWAPGGGGVAGFALQDPDADTGDTEVFATIIDGALSAALHEDPVKSGAIIAPTPRITRLSRLFGPISDQGGATPSPAAPQLAVPVTSQQLSPSDFFPAEANILGVLPLSKIISALVPSEPSTVPSIISQTRYLPDLANPFILSKSISWSTNRLQEFKLGSFFTFSPTPGSSLLQINSDFELWPGSGTEPTYRLSGLINNFSLRFDVGVAGARLDFSSVAFTASNDKPPAVNVNISGVTLLGALAFIQAIAEHFKHIGRDSGVTVSVTSENISIRLPPISLPDLSIGVFALKNIAISNSCIIPLRREPVSFSFSLGSPDKPFLASVGIFGGGGHIGMDFDANGVRGISASIEFGIVMSVSLGIASGSVRVVGGVFYGSQRKTEAGITFVAATFKAYVRATGEVRALCVGVSVDIYVGLEVVDNGIETALYGEVIAVFSVEVFLFKVSFSVRVRHRFAGSKHVASAQFLVLEPAAPSSSVVSAPVDFSAMFNKQAWEMYWGSFDFNALGEAA
jgi:hypothetical protein